MDKFVIMNHNERLAVLPPSLNLERMRNALAILIICFTSLACSHEPESLQPLSVSDNGRFLVKENGEPFFWLGDTGWRAYWAILAGSFGWTERDLADVHCGKTWKGITF